MLTYLSPLPLLPYFSVTYLLLSSLYILCSRWPPKRGRAGSGSGPKSAVYHYLYSHAYRSHQWTFWRSLYTSYDVFPCKNVPLGLHWYCSNLGVKSPQNPNFGSVERHFPFKHTKYSNFYYKNYSIDSNQILSDDEALQVLLVDGPKMRPANPRLQNWISPPPFHRFWQNWHSDASGASVHGQSLNFLEFEYPRWQTADILKNRKIAIIISSFVWPILKNTWHCNASVPYARDKALKIKKIVALLTFICCYLLVLVNKDIQNLRFWKSKMADQTITISLQPFYWFWWNLAQWCT